MRYWLVMPAAGVGRRFGEHIPKQYADLHGRTVMEWSLAPFLYDSRCLGVVVVLGVVWWGPCFFFFFPPRWCGVFFFFWGRMIHSGRRSLHGYLTSRVRP